MRRYNNFTLTEMLAVIAIIVIVISAAITGYNMAMKSARETATKATIMKLELALNELHKKYHVYPATAARTDETSLHSGANCDNIDCDHNKFVLIFDTDASGNVEDPNNVNYHITGTNPKGYLAKLIDLLDFEDLDLEKVEKSSPKQLKCYLVDGFGNKFIYYCPGKINKKSFDIISAGEDGIFYNEAKIMKKEYEFADFEAEDNDDIANFNLGK